MASTPEAEVRVENAAELDVQPYTSFPEQITADWARTFSNDLEKATWRGQSALKQLLPATLVVQILERATALCKSEPTLVEVHIER